MNAEVKCLPWEPDADRDGSVMRATLDLISSRDTAVDGGSFVVSSFYLGAVDLARAYTPGVETGWLTHSQAVADGARLVVETRPRVDQSRRRGRARRWPVTDRGGARPGPARERVDRRRSRRRALAAAGADILITNVPDVVIAALSTT